MSLPQLYQTCGIVRGQLWIFAEDESDQPVEGALKGVKEDCTSEPNGKVTLVFGRFKWQPLCTAITQRKRTVRDRLDDLPIALHRVVPSRW
jgi:hypothetical protein